MLSYFKQAVILYSKLNKMFYGYFDPENMFLNNESKYFFGDIIDSSAKKDSLVLKLYSLGLGAGS